MAPSAGDQPLRKVHSPDRIEALRRLAILDTPTDVPFDRLTRLASDVLRVPITLLTLVDDDRQFFKCQVGLPEPYASRRETALSHSFCQHVVESGEPLVIRDARQDPVLRSNLAIPDLGVVAYAGIPLTTSDGFTLGTFCAIDTRPRNWTDRELELLEVFAAAAMAAVELHAEREAALRVATRHQVLTDAATDAIVVIDDQSRILDVNSSAERMFGYARMDLITADLSMIQPAELRERHRAGVERYLRTGERQVSWAAAAAAGRHRSGREFPIEIAFGEFVEQGSRRFIGVIRDTSDRVRLEAQLRHSQKMEAVGQLAGGIAHDFNNLLTAIGGYGELAASSIPPDHPAHPDLAELRGAVGRAAAMTRQLLALSRRQIIEPVVFDPAVAILEMAPLLHRLIGPQIDLVVDAPIGLSAVRMDPAHLDQTVLNLVVNARDAMPSGGTLSITIERAGTLGSRATGTEPGPRAERRRSSNAPSGEWLRISVRDTGAGIAPDAIEHVFDPFFTTKEVGQGTGLGLATVYGIVQQAGGSISVSSRPGAGASFEVLLPIVDGDHTRTPNRKARRAAISGSPTILLVEDEAGIREVVARVLEAHGCRVVSASDGAEAMDRAAELEQIALLITDVVLPGSDGPTVAGRIIERHGPMPVLYVSGHPGDRGGEAALLRPSGEFLAKPFTGEELVDRVSSMLREPGGSVERRQK